jgi:TonB-dependent receptor
VKLARRSNLLGRMSLVGLCVGVTGVAQAQSTGSGNELDEIVVTGFRQSLQNSTEAKRDAVGFTDSVFSEDMGKFPDTNIAESFNRIPGITITREVTGEGLQIAIRGLGTNFTRVLLNNAPVAVASTGRTDAQSTNREVDLDLFPTELFSQLTVAKTPSASQLEGGIAGTVNMRSARPFDKEGTQVVWSVDGTNSTEADKWGGRASVLASGTWGKFGALAGIAAVRNEIRTTGFETIGWTNPNLTEAQAGVSAPRNNTGSGNWTIPATVPAGAGAGLVEGTVIDRDFLLANNPGRTIEQIDNAIIPRLGRPMEETGTKERTSAVLALEFRPTDDLHFYVDSMYAKKENDLERIDMNWIGRNGAVIPLNMQVDREDCANGCVVTSATYANSQFFLEYRPHIEDVEFWGVNPGMTWKISDKIELDVAANWTKSEFHRESPTFLPTTPLGQGVTVTYENNGGIPSITSNIDLNDPANFGWYPGSRVNIQDEYRDTETKGARASLTFGDEAFNVKVGGAYDDVMREIKAYDGSQAWQNAVCGNDPNVFVPGPNSQPACTGAVAPGAAPAGFPAYPGLGTGYSAGFPALNYSGSRIPNGSVPSYLRPGPGFVTADWARLTADTGYAEFHANAPEVGGSNTGAGAGFVREKSTGFFVELNGTAEIGDKLLRYNVGARYVETDQEIGGLVTLDDPRNFVLNPVTEQYEQTPDGSRYPQVANWVYRSSKYDEVLPSANVALNITPNAIVRAGVSRSMTRPDPNAMRPGMNFTSPSADTGSRGNPSLEPFLSDNIDLGFEYYTGNEGYFGVAAFRKEVTGFTTNRNTTMPFSALAEFGINYNTLTPTQQIAIDSRGGPNAAMVTITDQVNASGDLTINGLEFNWVQPLDFLLSGIGLEGLGFTANYTIIDQKGTGAAPAIAIGVAPTLNNFTLYYERGGISARISRTYAEGSQVSGPNQSGFTTLANAPTTANFSEDYKQWDFSSTFDLAEIFGWSSWAPQIKFDVINLTDEEQRTYFQFSNATFTQYNPGRAYIVGLRGRF